MTTRTGKLGATKSLIDRRWAFRGYRRLFGAEDMHSHYRWDAISRYLDLGAATTLEVGGGDGRISFEAADRRLEGEILLTEFDPASVGRPASSLRWAGTPTSWSPRWTCRA